MSQRIFQKSVGHDYLRFVFEWVRTSRTFRIIGDEGVSLACVTRAFQKRKFKKPLLGIRLKVYSINRR